MLKTISNKKHLQPTILKLWLVLFCDKLLLALFLSLLSILIINGIAFGYATPHDPIYEVNVDLNANHFNPHKNETCDITATITKLDSWGWGPIPPEYDIVNYTWDISIAQASEPYTTYKSWSGNGLSVTNIPYPFATVSWDGKNDNGEYAPIGEYYIYVWVNAVYTPETFALTYVGMSKTVEIQNIILKKVRVYYRHDLGNSNNTLPIAGYPTNSTPVTVKAIIWADDGSNIEKPYTIQTQDEEINDGKWYAAGSEGAQAGSDMPNLTVPVLSVTDTPKIYKWPNTWQQPEFEWKVLFNKADKINITDDNKNYSFYEYDNLLWSNCGWEYNDTLYQGTWRFKAKAFLDKDTPNEQFEVSADTECATRISVLDSSAPDDPYGNGDYIRWLTAYLDVPYEWGGHWVGGLEGKNVGGSKDYDGYGTDCAGLVSIAARWAGLNWNPWRAYTFTLKYGPDWKINTTDDDYYSTKIDQSKIKVGHVLNRVSQTIDDIDYPGHVVTVYDIYDPGIKGELEIKVIEAVGNNINSVKISTFKNLNIFYLKKFYEIRELNRY